MQRICSGVWTCAHHILNPGPLPSSPSLSQHTEYLSSSPYDSHLSSSPLSSSPHSSLNLYSNTSTASATNAGTGPPFYPNHATCDKNNNRSYVHVPSKPFFADKNCPICGQSASKKANVLRVPSSASFLPLERWTAAMEHNSYTATKYDQHHMSGNDRPIIVQKKKPSSGTLAPWNSHFDQHTDLHPSIISPLTPASPTPTENHDSLHSSTSGSSLYHTIKPPPTPNQSIFQHMPTDKWEQNADAQTVPVPPINHPYLSSGSRHVLIHGGRSWDEDPDSTMKPIVDSNDPRRSSFCSVFDVKLLKDQKTKVMFVKFVTRFGSHMGNHDHVTEIEKERQEAQTVRYEEEVGVSLHESLTKAVRKNLGEKCSSKTDTQFALKMHDDDLVAFSRTITLFDWDDTLLPSTMILDDQLEVSNVLKDLYELELSVIWLLSEALHFGAIRIVTAATPSWIEATLKRLMPSLKTFLKQNEIAFISARKDLFFNSLLKSQTKNKRAATKEDPEIMAASCLKWKSEVFNREATGILEKGFGVNMIVLGDSQTDVQAAYQVMRQIGTSAALKAIKFKEKPTIDEVKSQLLFCKENFKFIARTKVSLDMTLDPQRK